VRRALAVAVLLLASSQATAAPVLALIVGNNRSQDTARPDLRYADDDALKFAQLFDTMTPGAHVEVLTRADPASAALYPSSGARPPTRAALDAAVARLSAAARLARAAGQAPELYFVFAGHGDAAEGKGHLELEDDVLRTADVEAVLAAIDASRTHVVLDSCNSFFVVHPRRPGGVVRRSTPLGVGLGGGNVGVFLSTSADAQVFEWSQLQSGVFSHAVRSGLFGAADADGDRQVTYRELEAFVRVATRGIPNEDLRPQVYVDAPDESPVLLDLRAAEGRAVELVGFAGRTTIRDENGVRILDVNAEPGFSPRVVLPRDLAVSVIAELVDVDGRRRLFDLPVDEEAETIAPPVSLSSTSENPAGSSRWSPASSSRGWGKVMAHPFGPSAMRTLPAPEALRGLSVAADQRVGLQLEQLADRAKDERLMGATLTGVGAASMVAAGGMMLVNELVTGRLDDNVVAGLGPSAGTIGGWSFLLAGGAMAAVAGVNALKPEPVEGTWASFQDSPADTPAERSRRVEVAWASLDGFAQEAEAERVVAGLAVGALSAAEVVMGGAMLISGLGAEDRSGGSMALVGAGVVSVGAVGIAASIVQLSDRSEVERSMELMRRDPELAHDAE
jgi:hypothetical protein